MENNLLQIYETLFTHYGNLNWWPARSPYEVIVGAILTQNTNWKNVEKAIKNFENNLTPEFIANVENEELISIIKPAGFFNQKSNYLKAVTAWFAGYDYKVAKVQKEPLNKLRAELLSVKGIGQETADSILLYAFNYPTFVVDAYTHRLCDRFPIDAGNGYSNVKDYFENSLPKSLPKSTEIYNNYHALIVINGKENCRKKNPLCDICPLADICMKINI